MRRFNKLLKSGTSLMLVFAMLLGMCSTAIAVGETKSTENSYVALGDFVTKQALTNFADGTVLGDDFDCVADLYEKLIDNQAVVAAADVIALGVGNADINIYAVNNVLGAIGKDVVGIGSVDYGTLEDALANCDALTRNAAMQVYDNLYGKLESAISERVTDAELVTTLLDILVYSAVSFVANYSAILEEVATVNPDATVMIVGLVNMLDGMAINFNGQKIELGKYFGYVVDALNVYLAAVPTAMQMNGEYENVTFLYAEASDAEVKYMMKPVSVEGISKVVEELVWPTLKAELQAAIPSEVKGVKVDIKLENEDGTLTEFGQNVFNAICAEIEKTVCAADEPNPIVLSTDINLDGLFGDVSVDVDTDALTESAMEMVMDSYKDWQKTAEGQAIIVACYNFMMGKVEETVKAEVKDYKVDVEGEELTILDAYADALNKVISEANENGLELGEITVEKIDWDALYASMIEGGDALAMFQSYLPADLRDQMIDVAVDKLYSDEGQAEIEAEVWNTLHNEYPGVSDEDILVAIEAKTGKTLADLMKDATDKAELEIPGKVDEVLNELWTTAGENLNTLYTKVKEGYDKAKTEAVALLEEHMANLPLALLKIADDLVEFPTEPVDVNEWIGDMRTELTEEQADVERLFNSWVNSAAEKLVVAEIDGILDDVLADEEVAPLMYLLGRLLVGDGLGRYITTNGSKALCAAMVEAYGDYSEDGEGGTVQDEIIGKVEKLIDLVLQYGPQAMNKVGAIEKLRSALDVMVEKLDGRGGAQVNKAIAEIESILDEIEAIANGETDKTAEDLVNAYIDLDATIEELRALIHGEEIPEDSEGAIREFIDAAAHGDYEIDYESYYVAVGDDSVEGYAELLAAELGLNDAYKTVASENVAASIEDLDAEAIAKADLITVGFSNNTFFKYMASQVNAYLSSNKEPQEMDWSIYVGDVGVKYVEKALNEIQAILAKDLHDNISSHGYLDEILMLAIESYAYASADYVFNYPTLIEAIREINPDALIVSVGMNNALAGMTVNVSEFAEGYEFALGEYVEYLTAAVNGEAKVFAMLNENMAYVHAPDVTIEADVNEVYDYYDNMGIYDFMVEIGTIDKGGFAGLETSDEGNEYIKKQIYEALNISYGYLRGDINLDGVRDELDLYALFRHCRMIEEHTVILGVFDINRDGEFDELDLHALFRHYRLIEPQW